MIKSRQSGCARSQDGHGGIDLWARVECLGGDAALRGHYPIHLRPQREYPVILGAGPCRQAGYHFLLQHYYRPFKGMGATEQVFQNRATA